MKKTGKTLGAILLSAVLAGSAACMNAVPVFADYTVTINTPESDTSEHIYEAYQVFAGDLHGTKENAVLSNVDWGSGVKGDELLAALKTAKFGDETPFSGCADASAVAKVLDDWTDDSANLQKFADIVSQHLNTATVTGTSGNKELKMTQPGYYFIKDQNESQDGKQNGAYTDYILKVVDSVEIDAKEDVPSISKGIVTDEGLKPANAVSIGDKVDFQLDSKVPDMSAYEKYFFVVNDKMSDGLTFDEQTVKVYIDDLTAPISADYYEIQTGADAGAGNTFQIVMKNFKTNYGDKSGKDIKITYSATLNEKADRSKVGNPNTVNLTYSNNPNHTYTGTNEPGAGEPSGITPDSKTITYTTGIMITKIDGDTKQALQGAEFEIKGEGVNEVLVCSASDFTADPDGEYYKLANGSFTMDPPASATDPNYDGDQTYKLTQTYTQKSHSGSGENAAVKAEVDQFGVVTFEGLGPGTYTITETKAPARYNKVAPIKLVITANPTLEGPNWKVTKNDSVLVAPHDIYSFEVENNMGFTLPGTGGIGTTIFYVVGGLFIVGGLVLLITKKRMNMKEK